MSAYVPAKQNYWTMKYQRATLKQITKDQGAELVVILSDDDSPVLSIADALIDSQKYWHDDQVTYYKKNGMARL